jgi:hypothetical protein
MRGAVEIREQSLAVGSLREELVIARSHEKTRTRTAHAHALPRSFEVVASTSWARPFLGTPSSPH